MVVCPICPNQWCCGTNQQHSNRSPWLARPIQPWPWQAHWPVPWHTSTLYPWRDTLAGVFHQASVSKVTKEGTNGGYPFIMCLSLYDVSMCYHWCSWSFSRYWEFDIFTLQFFVRSKFLQINLFRFHVKIRGIWIRNSQQKLSVGPMLGQSWQFIQSVSSRICPACQHCWLGGDWLGLLDIGPRLE